MLQDVAAIATALGVTIVAVQLWYTRRQERVALEDRLTREYREITLRLPPEAFFDPREGMTSSQAPSFRHHLELDLHYIDLTNQQIFLRSQRRVSRRTWNMWREGIEDNLKYRPAFRGAWEYIDEHAWRSFMKVWSMTRDWDADPACWSPPWWDLSCSLRRRPRKLREEPFYPR
ncbi:MAG TPA: hypothetical protein VHY83_04230 [Solirubrobacteraceae bacterium]|jgi:hypothetical protein|nr:hypothetical protein [Solirubrobacteraceae bacterium]